MFVDKFKALVHLINLRNEEIRNLSVFLTSYPNRNSLQSSTKTSTREILLSFCHGITAMGRKGLHLTQLNRSRLSISDIVAVLAGRDLAGCKDKFHN